MPEVIADAAEYFDPNEFESMRCAIENVVYSAERMADLRNKGLARLRHFSWKNAQNKPWKFMKRLKENADE